MNLRGDAAELHRFCAGQDRSIPNATVAQMQNALATSPNPAARTSEFVL